MEQSKWNEQIRNGTKLMKYWNGGCTILTSEQYRQLMKGCLWRQETTYEGLFMMSGTNA